MGAVEVLKIVFFGVVEGVTEWLPISSTGHMLLADEFITLDMSGPFKEMYFVVIQLGAILAVAVVFWEKMLPVRFEEKPVIQKECVKTWLKVFVACIPSAVFGFLFDDLLERRFGDPVSVAAMLIIYGIAFILIEKRSRDPRITALSGIDFKTAFAVGLFQVLSLIPGTSRSGATIIGALLIGVSRAAAAEFTFFLAVPTMLGASALKIVKFGFDFSAAEVSALLIGLLAAFAVSLLAIRFLMGYVKRHDFKVFGWYRIILGVIVLACFGLK